MVQTTSRTTQRTLPRERPADPPAPVEDRVRGFWAKHSKGNLNPVLPESHWMTLAENVEIVLIHAVREGTTKFGPAWMADIEIAGNSAARYDGDPVHWTTIQSKNAVRDPMMEAMRDEIKASGEPMPATLKTFDTDAGTGWDFAPPPASYFDQQDVPF